MRFKIYCMVTALFVAVISSYAETLQSVYQNALPGLGYDKLLILHSDSIYTGGLLISDEAIGIKGNGALIDLQGDSLSVKGNSRFEMDGCVVINGSYGLAIKDNVSGFISHCTFYGNQVGIRYMSTTGIFEVVNTILSNNTLYGFACHQNSDRYLQYIDSYSNTSGDFVEWCPS